MLPKRIFRSQADGADSFRHCGAFDSNHVLAPRCREREPSTHLLSTDSCRKRMAAFDPFLPLPPSMLQRLDAPVRCEKCVGMPVFV